MKTLFQITIITALSALLASCGAEEMARAPITPSSGSAVSGNVVFTQKNGEVLMEAKITGLSEGIHAIHIHENGDCSAEDGSSAGGHWDPTSEDHGEWSKDHFHRGDIGNMEVGSDGIGYITKKTDLWCVGCKDETKNVVGKSIIVHADEDDFISQPSGAAGKRIGCGVIQAAK
ncbi:MAG: superoxide dismutase family protein [Flavobacteriales bacterium]|nr:superoxide dismutase family protein [Flavobacteriales bacterium]